MRLSLITSLLAISRRQFLLRIEDTDSKRFVPGAEELHSGGFGVARYRDR